MQTHRLAELDPRFAGRPLAGASIAIYTSLHECEAVWRQAAAQCSSYLFQSFEWQSVWSRTTGARQRVAEFIVHMTGEGAETLLLIPLGIYRSRYLSSLQFLGGALTDYNAPLMASGFADSCTAEDFARLWRAILKLLPKVDIVWLARLPETLDGAANPMLGLSGAIHTANSHCTVLPASFTEFCAARSSSFFKRTRTQARRLARVGPVEIRLEDDADSRIESIRTLARQKSRWTRERGHRDLFAMPGQMEFYETLTKTTIEHGKFVLASMRVDNRIVATQLGFVYRDRYYCLILSRESGEWERYSVGRQLMEWMVKWCIAECGIKIFDLTIGDEPYKLRWTDRRLPLYELISPHTVNGMCFMIYRRVCIRMRGNRLAQAVVRYVSAVRRAPFFGKADLERFSTYSQ